MTGEGRANEDGPASETVRYTPRGRGWKIPAALVLLGLAVGVAALAAAPWLLRDPGRMSRLVARLVPDLDADVTFRTVRVGWTGPLMLEGIRIVPRDGSTSPLAIERIEGSRGLAAILASWGDVGRVRVTGLEADVVFDEARRSNLTGLFRPAPDDGGEASARGPRRSPLRMRVEVADALVRIAAPWSPEPWQSDPIDIVATLAAAPDAAWSEWTIDPVEVLSDARLEPVVAQSFLAYIAPVLAGATRTSGRFSLRLDGARLPVGRPADATLAGVLAMHEVVVGPGPLVENLLASLPFRLPAPPEIRIADESRVAFRLADRRVTHDGLEFGLPLARPDQRLDIRSSGSVGIDDRSLDLKLRLPIPADLPQDRPVLAALAGKAVSVGIRGELGAPRVEFDGSIREAAGSFVGDLVDRLRAGQGAAGPTTQDGAPSASGDTTEAIVDLVGGIIDEVARRRAERRAAEEANPDAVPPRRMRERLRVPRDRRPPAVP